LWTYSTSKIKRPVQTYPSTKACKLWQKYLLTHLNSNLKFDISLGKWYRTCHQHQNWKFTSYQVTIIQTTSEGNNIFKLSTSQTRQSKTYIRQSTDAVVMYNITTPTIPNFINNNSIKCNSCDTANNLVLYFKPSTDISYLYWYIKNQTGPFSHFTATYFSKIIDNQVVGECILQSEQTIVSFLKFSTDNEINPNSLTAEAYSCLCIMSHVNRLLKLYPRLQFTLKVSSKHIKANLSKITNSHTPTICYRPEWDIFCSAVKLMQLFPSMQIEHQNPSTVKQNYQHITQCSK
jgi:hypothetical protein